MFNLEINLKAENLSSILDSLCDIPEKFKFSFEEGIITININCEDKNERILIKAKAQEYLRKRFSNKIRKHYNKAVIEKYGSVEYKK